MREVNLKKMKIISIVWGIVLFSLIALLTIIGLIYKKETKEYKDFEITLKEKTKEYVENKSLLPDDNITITLEELKENKVIENTKINDKECEGYIIVTNENGIYEYLSYVKCGNYKTKGYKKD